MRQNCFVDNAAINLDTSGVNLDNSWFGTYFAWGENKITAPFFINPNRATSKDSPLASITPTYDPSYTSPYSPNVCTIIFL